MLDGRMRHRDNHGNEGLLTPGSVQWMTAGRGLVHSEMPEQESGQMRGFQLWVNLPAKDKMTDPKYQEFAPERIPVVHPEPGVDVKVIAAAWMARRARSCSRPPIRCTGHHAGPGSRSTYALPEGHNAFAYVFEGGVTVGSRTPRVTWHARSWRCWAAVSSCTFRPAAKARG